MANIKLKNLLAENMRRFRTKNLNEDDSDYKVNQEQTKLKNIVDKLVTKMRSMSEYQIDMISDEDAQSGTVEYKIMTTVKWQSGKGRKFQGGFIKPMMRIFIDSVKDETGNYVNVETGKLYVTIYPDTNPAQKASLHQYYKTEHDIEIGAGMFGKPEDSIVDEILSLDDVTDAFRI